MFLVESSFNAPLFWRPRNSWYIRNRYNNLSIKRRKGLRAFDCMSITYFVILNSSIKCKKRYHLINGMGDRITGDTNEKLNGNYKIILPVTEFSRNISFSMFIKCSNII